MLIELAAAFVVPSRGALMLLPLATELKHTSALTKPFVLLSRGSLMLLPRALARLEHELQQQSASALIFVLLYQ